MNHINKKLKAKAQKRKKLTIYHHIKKHGNDILQSPNFKKTEDNIQHGTMSVRRHSIQVAKFSLRLSNKFRIKCNQKDLVRGALLHDYFLYDWHDKDHVGIQNLHGFFHPNVALTNAEAEYKLTNRQKDIIKKHMWPLTVVPPMCREAWIVSIADKYCSFMETAHLHRGSELERHKRFRQSMKKRRKRMRQNSYRKVRI